MGRNSYFPLVSDVALSVSVVLVVMHIVAIFPAEEGSELGAGGEMG